MAAEEAVAGERTGSSIPTAEVLEEGQVFLGRETATAGGSEGSGGGGLASWCWCSSV